MQFTTTMITLLAAAVSALPQATPVPAPFDTLTIWRGSGCQPADFIGSVPITNQTTCQNLPAGITSATLVSNLPAGCTATFFPAANCPTSGQNFQIPRDSTAGRCFEFGPGRNVTSVLVAGTCAR